MVNVLSQDAVAKWIEQLIEDNNIHAFYTSTAWLKIRAEVLEEYKHECQHCKAKGRYTRAVVIHHVQYVRKHPRYALSKTYTFRGKTYINLIPLCESCHAIVHNRDKKPKQKPLTIERW